MPNDPSPPPPELIFRPEGLGARVRYAAFGRALLTRSVAELLRVPAGATPHERAATQRRVSARLLRHLGVRLELEGLEHVGPGPYLVASLHEGMADVLCLLQLPLPLRFVARDEIFTWPGVGPAITQLGHVAINPEHPTGGYRGLLRAARDILAGGESLAVFVQGTVAGIESDVQRGAFEVARRLGYPLLPVVISGSHRIWEHPFAPTLRYGVRVGLRALPELSVAELREGNLETLRVRLRRAMKGAALSQDMPAPRHYDPDRDGYWDGYRFDMDPDFPEVYAKFEARRAAHMKGSA